MGFKLVRVDATEPCKLPLPLGSHFIGRGKFLDCNDHRVSRKHAELIVTLDSILLKSLHQNPCFFKKKSSKETIIFSQPDSQVLNNGDQFGLIPDSFWYEVIYCLEDSAGEIDGVEIGEKLSCEQNVHAEKDVHEMTTNGDSDTNSYEHEDEKKMNYSSDSVLGETSESPSLLFSENPTSPVKETGNESQIPPPDMDTTSIDQLAELKDVPNESVDQPNESVDQPNESTDQPNESTDKPNESTDQSNESTDQPNESTDQPNDTTDKPIERQLDDLPNEAVTVCKRAHSRESSPCDVKKVKTESQESNKESEDCIKPSDKPVKTEPTSPQDVKAGPSNDQGSSSNNVNNIPSAPQSPTKPANKPLRERCMYGANCYRRNPHHKSTFSHPSDPDWGGGARAPCPWGAACRRADPRHHRDHTHPAGAPHRGNRPGMQLVRRHGNNFFINANAVHFHDDHFEVEDSDGDSVDYDYEF